MDSLHRMPPVSTGTDSNSYVPPTSRSDTAVIDQFPSGLKVLVVDDDITCLRILEQKLRRCKYQAITCSKATEALELLREKKGYIDMVLSDVHMPDMDGFKLLELVGLEMDLPVIMMSADGRTSTVMRGVRHGACDYLIKPIREEELKNLWQHVVRKKWNENKEHDNNSYSFDENDKHKRGGSDGDSSTNEVVGVGVAKTQKKKRRDRIDEEEEGDDNDNDEGEMENDDPATSKKPRVVWSVELHQQFVSAVNQLGIDKAVPKRILELMNVPGLTRENVASHLQKFRLYLKRLSGVAQHGIIPNSLPYCGALEQQQNTRRGFDIPPQTLAALQSELLGHHPSGGILFPGGLKGVFHIDNNVNDYHHHHQVAYGQPLMRCPSSDVVPKQLPANIVQTGYGYYHQQQKPPPPLPSNNMILEPSRSMNVPPSCMVIPNSSIPITTEDDIKPINVGFIGKGTCSNIPKRFAINELDSTPSNFNNNNNNKVKQEPNPGIPISQHHLSSSNDLMGVFSK